MLKLAFKAVLEMPQIWRTFTAVAGLGHYQHNLKTGRNLLGLTTHLTSGEAGSELLLQWEKALVVKGERLQDVSL